MLTSIILPGLLGRESNEFGRTYREKDAHNSFPVIQNVPSLILPTADTQENIVSSHVERKLGETEVSYFLPSRESGVNDMYLHLGCHVPLYLVERRRVLVVWAIMRIRHPLLASKVKMNAYDDILFTYDAPHSPNEALALANQHLEYREQSKDDLIDTYLNGPRTLSNERLSYLIVSQSEQSPKGGDQNINFLICATHFLGDGMALHQFANDFFALLGSTLSQERLTIQLSTEWSKRCSDAPSLPSAMEDRLPVSQPGAFRSMASRIDFDLSQQKLIGGHYFPKQMKGVRHTIVVTISISPHKTKRILMNCKTHGVSVSAALFALCNIAWTRSYSEGWELPIMMYSALNMRPNLMADKKLNDSYWFIAIGYFNVILPSFFPKSEDDQKLARVFWHRARAAKAQSAKAAKSPMSISRCRQMAVERGARARVWAKEDDDKLGVIAKNAPVVPVRAKVPLRPKAPSTALIGLSLLGNLDGIYKHTNFPDVKFHTLTTGSRQRSGGMLLFGYTFTNKLWISLGYDKNGFKEETVHNFWKNVVDGLEEFLVPAQECF